jgi:NAD(P)-dependent dehydrogenase (short-subunit alcohol dehydrogenase family)
VKAVADHAVREYGRLDAWVHLAAVGLFATFEQTTPEEFERVIDVNLMGQVYGAMAALPHIKREGRGPKPHLLSRSQALLPFA